MFVAQANLMPSPRRERASTRPPVRREHPGAPRASWARRRDGPQVSRDRGWHKVALSPRQRSRDRALTCENGTSLGRDGIAPGRGESRTSGDPERRFPCGGVSAWERPYQRGLRQRHPQDLRGRSPLATKYGEVRLLVNVVASTRMPSARSVNRSFVDDIPMTTYRWLEGGDRSRSRRLAGPTTQSKNRGGIQEEESADGVDPGGDVPHDR